MGCDWVLDHLSEYIDDELTPQEAQEVQAHLAGCLSCAQAYQEDVYKRQAYRCL